MNPLDGTEVFSQLLQRLMLATDEVEKIELKDLIKICQEREERDERKQERERDERKQERERDERKQEREQATKLLLIKETEETERTRIMRIGIFYPTTVK